MSHTIVSVKCPACYFEKPLFSKCLWCNDSKRLSRSEALKHADLTWCFAGGGYIAGDNSYEEMREDEAKAKRIASLCGDAARYDRK